MATPHSRRNERTFSLRVSEFDQYSQLVRQIGHEIRELLPPSDFPKDIHVTVRVVDPPEDADPPEDTTDDEPAE